MHPLADPARTHRRGRLNDLHPQILTIARERTLASADHWSVAELTDDDVREMKQFLTDTCTDVKRWLPEPEWCPGWQSEAPGGEMTNEDPMACGALMSSVRYMWRRRCS